MRKRNLILIADDEEDILKLLQELLENKGYVTVIARNSEEAIDKAKKLKPDLIILDVRFPTIGGIGVCRILRSNPITKNIPILMLTVQNTPIDRVIGLEAGADDYLGKPFTPEEIVARVKAILRRVRREYFTSGMIKVGKIKIDIDKRAVWIKDRKVDLTQKEFELFLYLVENKGRVISREELMREVWELEYFPQATRTVDIHIANLRKKLKVKNIKSVFGIGYMFEEE